MGNRGEFPFPGFEALSVLLQIICINKKMSETFLRHATVNAVPTCR